MKANVTETGTHARARTRTRTHTHYVRSQRLTRTYDTDSVISMLVVYFEIDSVRMRRCFPLIIKLSLSLFRHWYQVTSGTQTG